MQLANRSVGVQYHQGSHYHTLSLLEGFVAREEMNVVHAGTVHERFVALENGEVEAATLMEPWISLAQKRGYKMITEGHYLGVENGPADMDPELLKRMLRAIKKSVTYINKNPKKYIKHMLAEIPEHYADELTPRRLLPAAAPLRGPGTLHPGRVRASVQVDADLEPDPRGRGLHRAGVQRDRVGAELCAVDVASFDFARS